MSRSRRFTHCFWLDVDVRSFTLSSSFIASRNVSFSGAARSRLTPTALPYLHLSNNDVNVVRSVAVLELELELDILRLMSATINQ